MVIDHLLWKDPLRSGCQSNKFLTNISFWLNISRLDLRILYIKIFVVGFQIKTRWRMLHLLLTRCTAWLLIEFLLWKKHRLVYHGNDVLIVNFCHNFKAHRRSGIHLFLLLLVPSTIHRSPLRLPLLFKLTPGHSIWIERLPPIATPTTISILFYRLFTATNAPTHLISRCQATTLLGAALARFFHSFKQWR